MIKKIDVIGIQLDNYTVREELMLVENYLTNDMLNAIEHVSTQMLLDAENDPVLREVIQTLKLSVLADKEILQAADSGTMQQLHEIDENDFFFEFFKRVERNGKSVFLLGETENKISGIRHKLMQHFPKLAVAGEAATDQCVGDLDAVVNDMNATTPDVIVSVLPSPMQEYFFWEHKDKMNANIWYGIGDAGWQEEKRLHRFFKGLIQKGKLKNHMKKYEEREPDSGELRK